MLLNELTQTTARDCDLVQGQKGFVAAIKLHMHMIVYN